MFKKCTVALSDLIRFEMENRGDIRGHEGLWNAMAFASDIVRFGTLFAYGGPASLYPNDPKSLDHSRVKQYGLEYFTAGYAQRDSLARAMERAVEIVIRISELRPVDSGIRVDVRCYDNDKSSAFWELRMVFDEHGIGNALSRRE